MEFLKRYIYKIWTEAFCLEKFIINGQNPLMGEVEISGAKNAAVAVLPAAILVDGNCTIDNLSDIRDVKVLLEIL